MTDDVRVYDLGSVRSGSQKRAPEWRSLPETDATPTAETPRATPPEQSASTPVLGVAAASAPPLPASAPLAVSAALLVPGAGHLVQRRFVAGAIWAASFVVLLGALSGSWGILPRLWAASAALGLRPEASVWFLGALAAAIVVVHLVSVLSVHARSAPYVSESPHPALTASASAVVPGWGQLLNGHGVRGALLVLAGWTFVLAWILAAPAFQEMLVAYQLRLPSPLAVLAGATARWALPAALWPLAIYDAGLWAWIQRKSSTGGAG